MRIKAVTKSQLLAVAALAPPTALATTHHPARQHTAAAADAASPEGLDKAIRAYVATLDPAISGQHGHDVTIKQMGKLVRGFALTPEAALPYALEWNSRCQPPWEDHELFRKLVEADKRPGPRGFLLLKLTRPHHSSATATSPGERPSAGQLRNYVWDERQDGETTKRFKRARRGVEILADLFERTDGWPMRVGGLLFARGKDDKIEFFRKAHELFAWIDWQYSFDGCTGFDWAGGGEFISRDEFLSTCRQHCQAWDQVESYPHEPPLPGVYYHHPDVPTETADGSHLNELVSRFNPDTPEDEELIRAFFLTLVWGGMPGLRPMFLFEASANSPKAGRGSGKSTVATIGSDLAGGFVDIAQNDRSAEIKTRLLSPDALGKRVCLIDNLKSLRFSDAGLEALITAKSISGRVLFVGEGARPNTIVWTVTANDASLSTDLADRAIPIRVLKPTYTPEWREDIDKYINEHRWKIFADCIVELRKPSGFPEGFSNYSRWAPWEKAVLSKCCDPVNLIAEIARRQSKVNDDHDVAAELVDLIREVLSKKGFDPNEDTVLIPSSVIAEEIVKPFHAEKAKFRASAVKWLYQMKLSRISKYDAEVPYRGAMWHREGQTVFKSFRRWNGDIYSTDNDNPGDTYGHSKTL